MSVAFEYYQPTFSWIGRTRHDEILSAIFDEPEALRRTFLSKFDLGKRFNSEDGYGELRSYLDLIEETIKDVLTGHSILFWLHIYRRIGPRLSPLHEGKTDEITTRLVRAIVECAIAKHGLLEDIGDIRPSSLVPADAILGGLFLKRLKHSDLERKDRERVIHDLRESSQFVLTKFRPSDLIKMYRVEGLAYEYWSITAKLRAIGKGDTQILFDQDTLAPEYNSALTRLIESYDARIELPGFFSADVGTFVGPSTASDGRERIFVPIYNASGDHTEDFLEAIGIPFLGGDSVLNFLPFLFPLQPYLESHGFLRHRFEAERGYSLRDYLLVVAALSWLVVIPPRIRERALKGGIAAVKLGLLNALRRGYMTGPPSHNGVKQSVAWQLRYWLGVEDSVPDEQLDQIIRDLTLDSPEKQSLISLWSRGPRLPILATPNAWIIDAEGIVQNLETLFYRLKHSEQERGISFEESLRSELERSGLELVQRRYRLPSGAREVDAAIRIGSTLWLVEAHSMERPLDFEIGKPTTIRKRNDRLNEKLEQVHSVAIGLQNYATGENYDISWAERIEHIVVSPFVEWIWSVDPSLWLNDETPRILAASELVDLLTNESATP